ncbi:unnamed protein product [Auanema sp. JU1783]|nr:unnamed protein product [Auanema sp. JU1783]
MSFVVEGVEEKLVNTKYADAFDICGQAMREALDLIRSEGYEDRTGWTLDTKNDESSVFYKDIDGLRYFTVRTKLTISPEDGHRYNWVNVEKMCEWNSNVKYSEKIDELSENTDIIHYGSNSVLMVSGRQFLCGRMRRITDGNYMISAKSLSVDSVPNAKDAVRAQLHLAFGRFREDPQNPSGSIYDYTLCADLRGMMPQRLVNQVMGKLLLSDMENTKAHFIRYSSAKNI